MEEDGCAMWECWNRMAMGMRPSPWVTIRLLMWMMEIVVGNPKDVRNPFGWDQVVLNLPGNVNYDSSRPRVYKWNSIAQTMACDCKFFCDDFRIMGPNESATKRATHKLETTMSYLGIQDATRKRRKVTQRPGEWTGSIILTAKTLGLFVTVSQKKWDRARKLIFKWYDRIKSKNAVKVNFKELESDLGFLVHLAMTYQNIKPFLKGFYATLNEWREGRDDEGWKLSHRAYQRFLQLGRRSEDDIDDLESTSESEDACAPMPVRVMPLLRDHIVVLADMFTSTQPILLLKRGSSRLDALYIFGDASGLGFGSSSWSSGEEKRLSYRYGVWGMSADECSSNYRELRNLVESLERSGTAGELEGKEISCLRITPLLKR